jgi:hypothetical protein
VTDELQAGSDATVFWGGYTRKGTLLHFAITSTQHGFARSACGLILEGGAWLFEPDNDSKTCMTCVRLEGLYA